MEAVATARRREQAPLLQGQRLTCPRCGHSANLLEFFTFDRPNGYEDELNLVFKCRHRVRDESTGKVEPCRCIFSPGLTTAELISLEAHHAS